MLSNKKISFILFVIISITTAATGTELKRTAASRRVIIAEALTNQIPPVLHPIVIQYAMRGYLESIAFLDLHTHYFSVKPGEKNLGKNRFCIIRSDQDGLIINCIRVAKKGTAAAIELQGNTEYHVYQAEDNAYTAIAKKCNVPAQGLILYTREVPFFHHHTSLTTERWNTFLANQIYVILWANSVKNISRNDSEYIQAKKQSSLFLAPDTTFSDFCVGLKKEYSNCEQIPHTWRTLELSYLMTVYEKVYPQYRRAARKQSLEQGILLKREKQYNQTNSIDPLALLRICTGTTCIDP